MSRYDEFLILIDVIIALTFMLSILKFKYLNYGVKYLVAYTGISLIVQIASLYLSSKFINNLFLLHAYIPLSTILIGFFYKNLFGEIISYKLMDLLIGVFLLFSIVNSMWFQGVKEFNSYAISLYSLIIVILSISTYVFLLNEDFAQERKGILLTITWINTGLFIYHLVGLLLFYVGDVLTTFNVARFRISWLFHSIVYLIQFGCIFIGLWKLPTKSTS